MGNLRDKFTNEEWYKIPTRNFEPGFTERNKYTRVVFKQENEDNNQLIPIDTSENFDNMLEDAIGEDNYTTFDENFEKYLINNLEIYIKNDRL